MPHLSVSQQQEIMNIVFIEASIFQLDNLKCGADTQANKNSSVYNLTNKLYKLTKNQPPETLFTQLLNLEK